MAMVERSEAELIKYIENLILANRNNALDEYWQIYSYMEVYTKLCFYDIS